MSPAAPPERFIAAEGSQGCNTHSAALCLVAEPIQPLVITRSKKKEKKQQNDPLPLQLDLTAVLKTSALRAYSCTGGKKKEKRFLAGSVFTVWRLYIAQKTQNSCWPFCDALQQNDWPKLTILTLISPKNVSDNVLSTNSWLKKGKKDTGSPLLSCFFFAKYYQARNNKNKLCRWKPEWHHQSASSLSSSPSCPTCNSANANKMCSNVEMCSTASQTLKRQQDEARRHRA